MARRRKVLGLPIGKKRRRIGPKAVAAAGAGLAALPPTILAARKAGGLVQTGKEDFAKAGDLANKAGQVTDAVDRHGSTIGKAGAALNQVRKLSKEGGGGGAPKLSHLIEEHIEVAVPRSVAYNQWTQFTAFPAIVKGAEQVEQRGREKVQWTSKIGPSRRSWTGQITEQVPDERIAFKSSGGLKLKGVVTFHTLDDDLTRLLVEMEYDPSGAVETVGNVLRVQRRRVRRDLRLFKHFVELRGEETGAWRGRIESKGGDAAEDSADDAAEDSADDAAEDSADDEQQGNGAAKRPKRATTASARGRSPSSRAKSANTTGRTSRSSTGNSRTSRSSTSNSRASSGNSRASSGNSRASTGNSRASSGARSTGNSFGDGSGRRTGAGRSSGRTPSRKAS